MTSFAWKHSLLINQFRKPKFWNSQIPNENLNKIYLNSYTHRTNGTQINTALHIHNASTGGFQSGTIRCAPGRNGTLGNVVWQIQFSAKFTFAAKIAMSISKWGWKRGKRRPNWIKMHGARVCSFPTVFFWPNCIEKIIIEMPEQLITLKLDSFALISDRFSFNNFLASRRSFYFDSFLSFSLLPSKFQRHAVSSMQRIWIHKTVCRRTLSTACHILYAWQIKPYLLFMDIFDVAADGMEMKVGWEDAGWEEAIHWAIHLAFWQITKFHSVERTRR